MADNQEQTAQVRDGRKLLLISFLTLALYLANVLIRKANIHFNWKIFSLGNVAEFLLLFLASTFLIIAAMQRSAGLDKKEAASKNRNEPIITKGEKA